MAADELRVRREMGFSLAEFLRLLPQVIGAPVPPPAEGRIAWTEGARRVELLLSPERERVLSPLVRLPVLDIELVLTGYAPSEAQAFLRHFDRQFFKGGG
ncbi:MAG: hypothetical protein HY423_01035 [Candidatus Lambdaproteobacteria bacterium]|nr:hypothetical protein [Candidatus Lambdaproteobacteria bacterium]